MSDPRGESGEPVEERRALRLVWSRPGHLPPPPPRRRVDLALAIERHLGGHWGLSDDFFARLFATSAPEDDPVRPAPRAVRR